MRERGKEFIARGPCLISGGKLGFNRLDSRLHGNDGGMRERGKEFIARGPCLISGGKLDFNRLDSRLHGNDGRQSGAAAQQYIQWGCDVNIYNVPNPDAFPKAPPRTSPTPDGSPE